MDLAVYEIKRLLRTIHPRIKLRFYNLLLCFVCAKHTLSKHVIASTPNWTDVKMSGTDVEVQHNNTKESACLLYKEKNKTIAS